MDYMRDVSKFHEKFGAYYEGPARQLNNELHHFRSEFLHEELDEYRNAVYNKDLVGQLDALVDLVYIAIGNAYIQGFDFNEAWRRVHAANMTKEKGPSERSALYDIIKGKDFVPAVLDDIVEEDYVWKA